MVADLIIKAYDLGYELSFGEAWRSDVTAQAYEKSGKGISNSLHRIRLAIDLNLFKNGIYQSKSSDHYELGKFWKELGLKYKVLSCWGGDFSNPDGNHYSIEHRGIK